MDIENLILYIGILVGWLITNCVIAGVGLFMGLPQMKLVFMTIISAGILFGLFLIGEIISFLKRFKVVRRE